MDERESLLYIRAQSAYALERNMGNEKRGHAADDENRAMHG